MAETFIYREFRIEMSRVGKGWRSAIFPPGAMRPISDSPASRKKCTKEAMVGEAKMVIDRRLEIAPN